MIPATLKSAILIEIRNAHTARAAEELVRNGVVPNEYLDKLLRIDIIRQTNNQSQPPHELIPAFNDEQRIKKLTELLQKHSSANTASFISNLYA